MKVVILAGGYGSRLSEHTTLRPKPMVEIGEHPILWHIMQIYAAHGFDDFVIACGYRGEVIKEYFHGYYLRNTDFTVRLKDGAVTTRRSDTPDWTVTLVDTGLATMTGGRLRRLAKTLGDEPFMVTYGDGVGNVDLAALLAFHRKHGKLATVTAVRPPSRFGGLRLESGDEPRLQLMGWYADHGWKARHQRRRRASSLFVARACSHPVIVSQEDDCIEALPLLERSCNP